MPAIKRDPDGDFGLPHHSLTILFPVTRGPAAILRYQHIIKIKLQFIYVKPFQAGIADAASILPRFGSDAKKAVLTRGEWAMA